jgi:hypothetical protein
MHQSLFKTLQHLHPTILQNPLTLAHNNPCSNPSTLTYMQSMFIKTWVVGKMRHFTAGIMEGVMADVLAGIPLYGLYAG